MRRWAVAVLGGVVLALATWTQAFASPLSGPGLLKLAKGRTQFHANQSFNWFGYQQGTLERGGKLFSSITGSWTVPTATQHTAGQAAFSATWIGIGGGCLDASCLLTDPTLIQTGTEQDVDSSGHATYSAWYELIPAPALTISMPVSAGDRMSATIREAVPLSELWTITLKNVTRGTSFTTTLPYPSTHGTAEWIEETPIVVGGGGLGITSLPNLSTTVFDPGTVNGASPGLTSSEQIQLINGGGAVIGAPSAPDSDLDGFADCAWASSCAAPGS